MNKNNKHQYLIKLIHNATNRIKRLAVTKTSFSEAASTAYEECHKSGMHTWRIVSVVEKDLTITS